MTRRAVLPLSLPPVAVSREGAAELLSISPSKFSAMVADGRMPKPRTIDRRLLWYVPEVEAAFLALPGPDDENRWDEV
jgi:predicted DNA-binding transcriptional regulator AlpA